MENEKDIFKGTVNEEALAAVKFDDRGLVPAIVQDFFSKKVLTLAYMNRESLDITLKEGRTCFWSRSRRELWRKGETSGNFQTVVNITADCDSDALVVQVIKDGPACHTGADSCFFNEVYQSEGQNLFSYDDLYDLISGRKTNPKEGSYTTYLFDKGMARENLAEEDARKKIRKIDKERASYYNFYTSQKWNDMGSYDVCLNTGLFKIDDTVSIIQDILSHQDRPVDER